MQMYYAANEELNKIRLQNSMYQTMTIDLEEQLRKAQIIELGREQSYNRCNLKFPCHQLMLVKQRKLRKTKLRINEINQGKIRSYNRILDITESIIHDNLKNLDKVCDELVIILKRYIETCKKHRTVLDSKLLLDIRKSIRFILNR